MKIERNPYRGTACISFGLSGDDDAAFKEWMAEAKKPNVNLFDAAEKVAKKRGVKTQITTSPLQPDEDDEA